MEPSIPGAVGAAASPSGTPRDPDADPLETAEWIEALDALIALEPDRELLEIRVGLSAVEGQRVDELVLRRPIPVSVERKVRGLGMPFGDDQARCKRPRPAVCSSATIDKPSAAPSDASRASSVFVEGNDSNCRTLGLRSAI